MNSIKSTVLEIGELAYFEDYPLLILFNNSAPHGLREVSVIHEFEEEPTDDFFRKGSKIIFGNTSYTVLEIGEVANQTFKSLGHISLYFDLAEGDELMLGAALLTPNIVPIVKPGDTIRFIR